MKLSVVIPTYNRANILKQCLERLSEQKDVEFEVIVVDDGSTDRPESQVSSLKFQGGAWTELKYIKQEKSHQGTARNRGVEAAEGEIIVFIGDDIFVEPGFLKQHHDCHAEHPEENVVVLGYTTWDTSLDIDPYMLFLEDSGWQFGYKFLKPAMIGRADPYKFFYTSNISLKKSFFEKEKFNEDFVCYGWEDIELGYRLWKYHDMQIYYEPRAVAYHHHEILPADLPKKMRSVGKSALYFQRLQPDLKIVPGGFKVLVFKALVNPVTLPFFRVLGRQRFYKIKSWHEFFKGASEERG